MAGRGGDPILQVAKLRGEGTRPEAHQENLTELTEMSKLLVLTAIPRGEALGSDVDRAISLYLAPCDLR